MMTDHDPIGYELTDLGADPDSHLYPVDSATRTCCGVIGGHARGCRAGLAEDSPMRQALDIVEARHAGDLPDVEINRVGRRRYVEINDYGHLVRLTPAGARELADYLLEAADAAEVPW
ncbi:hypothetical protein NM962_06825 [Mycobacterium sp. SVM_VP21]|nr:hypothetical protein NM962_06825 [Mycobacterium sp. SVM_VP21]